MDLDNIPFLRWFVQGLDDIILAEARAHPYFIVWFRSVVNDACDRMEAKLGEEFSATMHEPETK